jgi:hypothetical protein
MTDLIKRDDDLLWPSAYVGTPEQLLNCLIEMWRREKRVTVSAVLHATIETLRALPAVDPAAIREAATVEALVQERDEYKAAAAIWQEDFIQENQRLYVATVKLAIAVEGLHKIANYTHIGEGGQGVTQHAEARIARAMLAELEKTE